MGERLRSLNTRRNQTILGVVVVAGIAACFGLSQCRGRSAEVTPTPTPEPLPQPAQVIAPAGVDPALATLTALEQQGYFKGGTQTPIPTGQVITTTWCRDIFGNFYHPGDPPTEHTHSLCTVNGWKVPIAPQFDREDGNQDGNLWPGYDLDP